jgi:hypothetical protein
MSSPIYFVAYSHAVVFAIACSKVNRFPSANIFSCRTNQYVEQKVTAIDGIRLSMETTSDHATVLPLQLVTMRD